MRGTGRSGCRGWKHRQRPQDVQREAVFGLRERATSPTPSNGLASSALSDMRIDADRKRFAACFECFRCFDWLLMTGGTLPVIRCR